MKNATLKAAVDLYRGTIKKGKGANKANSTNNKLPLFERGKGCTEEDARRFVRKLLIEGHLEERIEHNKYVKADICYVKVSPAGNNLIGTKQPKVSVFNSPVLWDYLTLELLCM